MSREKDCRWHFANQIGGREDGPNDAVTQNLKGNKTSTLIREAFQNALDAAQGPASEKGPVRVEISFGTINGLDFPNYNELGEHIRGCFECFDDEQAHSIYDPMLENFDETRYGMNIGYIKIADFNTKGMDYVPETNPDYRKKPFYSFVRSVGVHSNESDGSGGSYGFGKAAYFNISPLRTLMVSTLTDTGRYFFEGVSALCTHKFNGETKVSVGFYDNNGGQPICEAERIPKPFRREEAGTNFYLMGVKYSDKERAQEVKEMICATLRNFWLSIQKGSLVAVVDGLIISKENLSSLMEEYFPSLVDDYKSDLNHNPRPYYEAYIHANDDDNHKSFVKNIPNLGNVNFYAYLSPLANDRIIHMRSLNMFVYRKKNQTNFGFYGLFLCEDRRGNLILRDMEPPRHDEWEPKWARKYSKDECKEAKDSLTAFITECILQLHPEAQEGGVSVNGAEDVYVPESLIDEDSSNGLDSRQGQMGNTGRPSGEYQDEGSSMTSDIDPTYPDFTDQPGSSTGSVRRVDFGWNPDPDGNTPGRIRTRGKDKKKRKGRGNQPGDKPVKGSVSTEESAMKVYVEASCRPAFTKVDGILYHDLIIRPDEDVLNGEIELIVGGDQDTIEIPIVYTSAGTVNGNCITGVCLKKDEKNVIRIQFEDNMRHSINLSTYECK